MSASAEKPKGRDYILRMQISNSCSQYQKNLELGANSDRDLVESEDYLHETFVSYIQALTGSSRRRIPLVWMEHSYARSATANAAGNAGRSAPRLLLVKTAPQCPDCHSEAEDDETIDVESVESDPTPPLSLDELPQCEKALDESELVTEEDETKPSWEDKLNSLPWNSSQVSLLKGAMDALSSARVAILTAGKNGAKRAAARGGAARAFRELLAAPPTRWQPRLAQWLHNALMEHLPPPLLACYKEIILTIKSKIPLLIEKMTVGHPVTGRVRGFENGASGPMIASGSGAPTDPGAPILLLLPSGRDKRDARWAERLRAVAQVHQVHSHQSGWLPQLPVSACLSQLVGLAKARTTMLKTEYPHRPLILVGQGPGAAIAVQLAVNVTGVAGVVCLGLPLLTADGPRGDPEDSLLSLPCPVLFVIGQNASQSSQQDVESIRLKLRIRSRLVVAGSADDLLRLPRIKRQLEGVTQRMLECAIAEEVGNFLTCLSQWDDGLDAEMAPESPSESCDTELADLDIPLAVPSTTTPSPLNNSQPSLFAASTNVQNNLSPNILPSPTSPISVPPGNANTQPIKRKGGKNITMPKSKKPRAIKTIKTTSPLKGRGMALYHVNNPPPEGTSISLGVLLNTLHAKDSSADADEKSLTPQQSFAMKSEPSSYVQISNNMLTKSFPFTGNGSFKDNKSARGIKVLENIPIKLSKMLNNKVMGSVSGLANTPLVLPRKIENQQQAKFTSANIMDIPIIFADDEKIQGTQKTSPSVSQIMSPSPGIKSIIINKQPMHSGTSTSPTKSFVQLKGPSTNLPPGINIVSSTPSVCFKQNVVNSNVKYTKLIVTKRTPEKTQSVNIIGKSDANEAQKKILTKPIIVRGKSGPMTAFKVLPGNILQKGSNVTPQTRQLIIKKTSTISSVKSNIIKANNKLGAMDSTSDKAIEAAVASITGEQDALLDNL